MKLINLGPGFLSRGVTSEDWFGLGQIWAYKQGACYCKGWSNVRPTHIEATMKAADLGLSLSLADDLWAHRTTAALQVHGRHEVVSKIGDAAQIPTSMEAGMARL